MSRIHLAQDGKCWDAAEKEFKLQDYESWPGYANNLHCPALLWAMGAWFLRRHRRGV